MAGMLLASLSRSGLMKRETPGIVVITSQFQSEKEAAFGMISP